MFFFLALLLMLSEAVLGRRVEDNAPYQNDNPQTW